MKYRIMQSEEPVSDDEIRAYRSFDKLLDQHKHYLWKRTLYRRIGFVATTTTAIIAGLMYYLYVGAQQPQEPKPASRHTLVQTQKQELRQPEQKISIQTVPSADSQTVNQSLTTKQSVQKEVKKVAPKIKEEKNTIPGKAVEPAVETAKSSFKEASPIGGYQQLFTYFQQSLQYPEQARTDSITGTVVIGFAINAAGKPQDIQVIKGIHPALDLEAIRLVAEMPLWTPAQLNGKPITTRQTVPLTFQLTSSH